MAPSYPPPLAGDEVIIELQRAAVPQNGKAMACYNSQMPISPAPALSILRGGQILEAALDRFAGFLNRRPYLFLILFSVAYFLITCYRASRKLFWFDEIFTVFNSRLPDMSAVWYAVTHGTDLNPPLFYVLTRWSEHLFGQGQVGTRLPGMLGFWIFCLCLFRFVSIRTNPLSGYISMLFPLVSGAYYYAYEARPNGAVLGFCGIALVCWQEAVRPERRWWCLPGLGGALACALLTHTWALLLFFPLAFGELVRSVRLKRIDWPVWLTMAASSTAILVAIPLIHSAKNYVYGVPFYSAGPGKIVNAYQTFLGPALLVLAGALALLCIDLTRAHRPSSHPNPAPSFESHEIATVLAVAAIPCFGFLIARLTGAPWIPRYNAACVGGFACMLGIVFARRPGIAVGMLLVLVVLTGQDFARFQRGTHLEEPSSALKIHTRLTGYQQRYKWIEAIQDKKLPVALLDPLDAMPTSFYAPPDLASRMVYLVWPDDKMGYVSLRNLGNGSCNYSLLSDFLAAHDSFLALGTSRSPDPARDLIRRGAAVTVEEMSDNLYLLSVTFRKKQ